MYAIRSYYEFSAFAPQYEILIPQSFDIKTEMDLQPVQSQIRFPAIVKPYKRTEAWENARLKKARNNFV